jgi:predicted outer membrane repeat protein
MRSKALALVSLLSGLVLAAPAAATDVVVGSGQPSSCTEAAFASAVNVINSAGGTITFNCGGPATITVTSQKVLLNTTNTNLVYAIDGGGNVTLSGGGSNRVLVHGTGTLNLRNITLTGGLAQGAGDDASGGVLWSDGALWPPAAPVHLNLSNVILAANATNLTATPTPPFSPFDYGGGALFTRWGIVTITDCTFSGNTANNTSGGAMHIRASTVNITRSVFHGNSSNGGGFGGAIHVDSLSPGVSAVGGQLQISATSFTNNTARNQGGAIYFYLYPEKSESVTFTGVDVSGNRIVDSSGTYQGTRAWGGGIAGDRGDVTIANSTIANNVAHSNGGGGTGGGIALSGNGTVTISNSTISGNRAEGPTTSLDATGGGLVIAGNTLPFLITHTTIAYNFAAFTGGGISAAAGTGTLRNTIVADNDSTGFPSPYADQCSGTLANGGGVLEYPANNPVCVSGAVAADPRLGPLTFNGGFSATHLLLAGSPAIDAGACPLAIDQRWVARPQGAACDLGAVEVGAPPPLATNFFTLTPCRVVDTRLPSGPTGGAPLICGLEQLFSIAGGCGLPSWVSAIAANVVVASPTKQGNLNAYAAYTATPTTSVVNYAAGATRANNAVIPLSGTGQIAVRCAPSGTAHVIVDVTGYFQ